MVVMVMVVIDHGQPKIPDYQQHIYIYIIMVGRRPQTHLRFQYTTYNEYVDAFYLSNPKFIISDNIKWQ